MSRLKKFCVQGMCLALLCVMAVPFGVVAQDSGASVAINQEELDSVLAPIALYPDSLVSQILMASTYPLEVVQAQRWAKENQSLKGDELAKALEAQTWDPSVKSLVNFPQVLEMMNSKLDWTQKLGDAFLAHQKEVMDTVQKLRKKAQEAGNLATTTEQKVIVEKETQTIIIESASPEVVYVPAYNPTVVYGTWWWPHYPPYYYYPAWYAPTSVAFSFGTGVAVGVAWGYAWGGCNWHHGDVDIDINRNTNFNQNINRNASVNHNNINRQSGTSSWQHDASHRKGVSYRDQATAQKFNRASSMDAAKSRESFRGNADQGRQNLARDSRAGISAGSGIDRSAINSGASSRANIDRSSQSRGGRESAFSGSGSASQVRSQSSRGSQSRQSMASRGGSSGFSGGASRSGGGASRGGGGRR